MANRSFQSARADIYSRITDDIVAAIENGAGEWQMPWRHDGSSIARPRNVASDEAYRGINVLALWVAAHRARHTSGIWGTYRQWAERGCQVRRGERATTVGFWKMGRRDAGEPSSDDEHLSHHDDGSGRARFVARGYQVFNQAQVDGHARIQQELPYLAESERIAHRPRPEHAANIGSCLPVLKSDSRAIFAAAAKAQQAADWMHAQQRPSGPPDARSAGDNRGEEEKG